MTISRTTSAAELPELLRVDEAAAWLGTSKGLIYELCRAKDLESVRIGRLLRIPRASLAQLARSRA